MDAATEFSVEDLVIPDKGSLSIANLVRSNFPLIKSLLASGVTQPQIADAIGRRIQREVPFYTVRTAIKRERLAEFKKPVARKARSSVQPPTKRSERSQQVPPLTELLHLPRNVQRTVPMKPPKEAAPRPSMVFLDAQKREPLLAEFFRPRRNPLLDYPDDSPSTGSTE